METQKQVCRHVVLFKFKENTTEETVQNIETAFGDLCRAMPMIVDFEWGRNSSPENLNNGFSHCFLLTFASERDRDAYLPHPAHVEFCSRHLDEHLEQACVVDYMTRR